MVSEKNESKILIFFVSLALLFWNPFSFYLIYGQTAAYTFSTLQIGYWVVFGAALLLIFLLLKNKAPASFTKLILGCSSVGILFSLLVLTDRLLSAEPEIAVPQAYRHPERQGLIFAPNTSLHHQTVEFNYTALANSFGLRQAAIAPDKKGKFRIVCVGDSWTYGWGVSTDKAFPQQLEKMLKAAGYKQVEVINAGQPGQYPGTYKQNMARVIPFLKPDMLLLGVLQMDDLVQEFENSRSFTEVSSFWYSSSGTWGKIKSASLEYFRSSFKHILARTELMNFSQVEFSQEEMKKSYTTFTSQLNELEKSRFLSLDDSLQQMFSSGNVNPGLLHFYIHFPDMKTVFNNPAHPYTRLALQLVQKDMREMTQLCYTHSCKPVFVNMPFNYFSGHRVIRTPDDFMDTTLQANNKIDSMYQSLAKGVQWPYIELTDHFKSLNDKKAYYFLYDGHPNEKGYEEMARYVALSLEEQGLLPAK